MNAYHHGDLRRALVEAALALASETQSWDFSLREVARRAGVSHNAPYRHFPEKRDLLAAVAAVGYEQLGARTAEAAAGASTPEAALHAIGVAYIRFGTENPARYRLIFGPSLADGEPPPGLAKASTEAKSVLVQVIERGIQDGRFAAADDSPAERDRLVLAAWSLVHGLTMLLIDGLAGRDVPRSVHDAVARTLLDGVLRR